MVAGASGVVVSVDSPRTPKNHTQASTPAGHAQSSLPVKVRAWAPLCPSQGGGPAGRGAQTQWAAPLTADTGRCEGQ